MVKEFHTSHAAELESLRLFRTFVEDACRQMALAENTAYDVQLAVDEACTNIIQHGYEGMNPGSIVVQLKLIGSQLVVTITDFGHSFEPAEPPPPDIEAILEDRDAGSFGLHLIYQTMDGVDYQATRLGNELRFTKTV